MPSPGLLEFWALASVTVAVMCCTFLSPMSPSHQIMTLEGRDGIQFLLQTLPVAKGLPHSRHLVCAYRTGYIREIGKKKDKPQNEKYCPATTQTVALTKKKNNCPPLPHQGVVNIPEDRSRPGTAVVHVQSSSVSLISNSFWY